jgi:hypothetical protein
MKKIILNCIIGCLLLSLTIYGQNIPRSGQEIPVFPGSVRNLEAQKQALKDYQEIHEGESIGDLHVSVYSVNSVPDEVCRFYIDKLRAKEGFPEDDSEEGHNPPWYEVDFFSKSLFMDQHEGNIKIHDGKWFKVALAERNQWIQGEWLASAYFEWTVRLNNGDMVRCSIDIIDDNSFDTRAKKVENKTLITLVSQIEKSDEDMDDY